MSQIQRLIPYSCCKRPYSMAKVASDLVRFNSSNDQSSGLKSEHLVKSNRPIYTPEEPETSITPVSLDNPPTTCCMSGCPNCVYIEWANALSKQMASADPIIAKKILENVEDPSMKAYLQMELRNLGLIK